MAQTEAKLRDKVMHLRSEVNGQGRRIAYLERQLMDPRAHEQHLDRLYTQIVKAWRCMLDPNTEQGSANWRHEGNGDDCIGELARMVPDRYWYGTGVKRAESVRWPLEAAPTKRDVSGKGGASPP